LRRVLVAIGWAVVVAVFVVTLLGMAGAFG
jgi:hypothetical protein